MKCEQPFTFDLHNKCIDLMIISEQKLPLFLYLDLEIHLYILMQTQRQAHKTCACPYNIDEPDAMILK